MKESEWIVSPKKLKENQERAIQEEEQKRREHKAMVKDVLILISFLIVFVSTLVIIGDMNQDTIDNCIKAGNTMSFCENAIG